MLHLIRGVFIAGLVGCVLLLAAVTRAQLLNAGHLSVSVRQAETVFDNGGNPWAFFSQIPSVAYDQGGSGIAYVATPDSGCATNGSSYRTDYINFNADAGQTPPFRIGCFLAGQLYRTTVNISASTPGPYVVNLSVANGGGSAASIAVLIDGNDSQAIRINVPTTGSYSTFTTAQSGQFNATVGNHVIAISCLTGDSTNHACGDMRWFQGGSPPSATIPEPARLAGFTNLVVNSDFTDANHANLTQWLNCHDGTGNNTNPEWYQGWITVGFGPPCSTSPPPISQVTDPVNQNKALQLIWQDSYLSVTDNVTANAIQTTNQDGSQGKMFTYYYAEWVMRTTRDVTVPTGSSAATTFWGTATFTQVPLGKGQAEYDGSQIYSSQNSDSGILNPGGAGGASDFVRAPNGVQWFGIGHPPTFPNWDWRVYHKYASRMTGKSDGVTAPVYCIWVEDVPDVSGLVFQGCINMPGVTSEQMSGGNMTDTLILLSGLGFDCNRCNLGSPYASLTKSIKIYVCPAYTPNQSNVGTASQCPTASANP